MRVAILGDVHGNFKALEKVLEDIGKCGVSSVIFLGDIVFFGEEPQKCFDALREKDPLVWIRGNTDDWFNEIDKDYMPSNHIEAKCFAEFKRIIPLIRPETGLYLSALKEKQQLEIAGKKILCVHGSDRRINEPVGVMTSSDDMKALCARLEADILLCGHTHSPYSVSLSGKLIINTGSVGKPADEPRPCWCLLTFEDNYFSYEFRRVNI
jgi:putative phosphoesterase